MLEARIVPPDPSEDATVMRASEDRAVKRASSRPSYERPRGWLTARPSPVDEQPPRPVPASDPDATLPSPRRKRPRDDDQLTIPLEHPDE